MDNLNNKYAIGVDIGGTHISSQLVNLKDFALIPNTYTSHEVDNQASAEEIFKIWCENILETAAKGGGLENVTGIGIAIPGAFDYKNGIALYEGNNKYSLLKDVDVRAALQEKLNFHDKPIRFMNDAIAIAVAEYKVGSAQKTKKYITLTLGTGFGSAFIEDGLPILEGESVPENGCLWYLPYKNGIADEYFSTRWFTNAYYEISGVKLDGVKCIADRTESEPIAKSIFETFGENLGEFLSTYIQQFGADKVVVGGNISKALDLFLEPLKCKLKEMEVKIEIVATEIFDNASIIGSAMLIDEGYFEKMEPLLPKML